MCLQSAGQTRDSSEESVQEFSFKQLKKNRTQPSDIEMKTALAGSLTVRIQNQEKTKTYHFYIQVWGWGANTPITPPPTHH